MKDRKLFVGRMEIKEGGQPGEFKARIAQLNVIDADNDVTLPGAFTDGRKVLISRYGHNAKDLPVGIGEIHEEGEWAVVDGKFFLDTVGGKEHYTTIKNVGDLQQWSYGYEVGQADEGQFQGKQVRFLKKVEVFEAAPVQRGAGVDTQTVSIKSKTEEKSINLDKLVNDIRTAFMEQFNGKSGAEVNASYDDMAWPREIYDDHLIADWKGDSYQVNFRLDDAGKYAFTAQSEWIRGSFVFIAGAKVAKARHEMKAGRVMAARNVERLVAALATLNEILKDAGLLETAGSDSADDGDGGATDKGRKPTAKEPQPSTLAARVAIDLMENE